MSEDDLTFALGLHFEDDLSDIFSTLTMYEEENIHLDSLKIDILCGDLWSYHDNDVMDKCINLAAKRKLTNLYLSLMDPEFVLPEAVFEVNSLQRLHLGKCQLKPERILVPAWPNLRELGLHGLRMTDEAVFESVIKGCSLIENLVIEWCDWGKKRFHFKVSDLHSLKKLTADLSSDQTIELRETAVKNLETLFINHTNDSRVYPTVNLGKHEYPNLKRLDLRKARVVEIGDVFTDFDSKFPRLEYLSLGPGISTLEINLSSSSLKEICLFGNRNVLEVARFDVPNVVSFKYRLKCRTTTTKLPKLLFTDNSDSNMPFEASIRVHYHEGVNFLNQAGNYLPPAGFITGIRKFTVTQIYWRGFSLPVARAILDAIFKIYRPETITYSYGGDKSVYYDDGGDCVEHNVKVTANISPSDEILELLKTHEKNPRFTAVFNLEYM